MNFGPVAFPPGCRLVRRNVQLQPPILTLSTTTTHLCLRHRSLYFNCVTTSCGHRFCRGCIAGARDCPACGADVGALEPDAATQGA